MRTQTVHDPLGIRIGGTAAKTDHMHVLISKRQCNLISNLVGTFNHVCHYKNIAQTLSPVTSKVSFHRLKISLSYDFLSPEPASTPARVMIPPLKVFIKQHNPIADCECGHALRGEDLG